MKRKDGEKLVPEPVWKYTCNCCEKKLNPKEDEIISITHKFGYGSKRDLDKHELHLCEECYETKILPVLAIRPDITEYLIGEDSGGDNITMKKAVNIADMVNKMRHEGKLSK